MNRNRKQNIRLLALILILLLGIGFAALAANLKIDGTLNVSRTSWDVHFENVQITQGSVTANSAPVSDDATTTEMAYTINFTKPGDYFEFTVDIVNDGTIDAMVELVSNLTYESDGETPKTLPDYLANTVEYIDGSPIEPNQLLTHNTSEKIKVRIEFRQDIEASDLPSSGDAAMLFKFKGDFKQSDNTAYERYRKFKLGTLVYFDPVAQDNCSESTFDLEAIKGGTSTCYKWRVIVPDDEATKEKITIQLDHHILNGETVSWTTSGNRSQTGPTNALPALENATSLWTIDAINYIYDTTDYEKGYGVLSCINGSCRIGDNNPITTNLKVRMITMEEMEKIIKTEDPEFVWEPSRNAFSPLWFSSNRNNIGRSDSGIKNTDLSWLVENTPYYRDVYRTDNNYELGYWTLTPTATYDVSAWHIQSEGQTITDYSVYGYSVYGYRPVIEIEKSKLN